MGEKEKISLTASLLVLSALGTIAIDLPIHEECDIVFSLIGAQEPIKNISKDATELTLDSREREIVVCYCSNNYIRTERTGYWTGSDEKTLPTYYREPVSTILQKSFYKFSKPIHNVVKLRFYKGDNRCKLAQIYTCNLAGSKRNLAITFQGCAADPELSPPTTPSLITSVDLPNTDLDQHNENIPNNEAPTTSLETTLNDRELEPFNIQPLNNIYPYGKGTRGVVIRLPQIQYPSSHGNNELENRKYQLVFLLTRFDVPITKMDMDISSHAVNAVGLYPGNSYTVKLVYVTEGGQNGVVAMGNFQTAPEIPSGPTRFFHLKSKSTTDVQFTWKEPLRMHINHIMGLSGYVAELHQTSEGGACLDEVLESVEGMMYSVHFNELEPFTRYCVRLYPVNAKGRALKKDIQRSDRFVRTYPEVPKSSPEIRHIQPHFKSVLVAWKPALNVFGNQIQYIIQYRLRNQEKWEEIYEPGYSYAKTVRKVFTKELGEYEIRLAIENESGRGPYTKIYHFINKPPVRNISMCVTPAGKLMVKWIYGGSGKYGAIASKVNVLLKRTVLASENVDVGWTSVPDVPASRGPIFVSIEWKKDFAIFFLPERHQIGNYPKGRHCIPDMPNNIKTANVDATSFTLEWTPPTNQFGHIKHYIVSVANSKSGETVHEDSKLSDTSVTVKGLENQTAYTVHVQAVSEFGNGEVATYWLKTLALSDQEKI